LVVILALAPVAMNAAADDSPDGRAQAATTAQDTEDQSWRATDDPQLVSKAASWQSCTPARVATFTQRVHVRCTSAISGVLYFAVSTADQAEAARALSVFSIALATGRDLMIMYDAADTTSGPPIGCSATDCRVALGVEMY